MAAYINRNLALEKKTDFDRWSNAASLEPAWDQRAEVAAGFVPAGSRVLDLGCGRMALKRFLPTGCTYQPCDLIARDEPHPYAAPFALEWMKDPWADVDRAGAWLLALESQLHPDVVHLNGFCHAALPWRAPVVTVAHSCVCSWWRSVHGVQAPERRHGMHGAMQPVAQEVRPEDHQNDLRRERPPMRPKHARRAEQPRHVGECCGREERERVGQQNLDHD